MMSGVKKKVPKRRFKEFLNAGDWEQHKLGDLYKRVNERNDGTLGRDKWISVAKMYFQDPDKVQSNNLDTRTYVMKKGDIAFEGHPNNEFRFGRFVLNDIGTGIISELFPIYRPITEYDLDFWKYAIQLERVMAPIFAKSITSSGNSSNKLDHNHFLNQELLVPNIEEQKKIGTLLSILSKNISLYQSKLDKLQATKKALLQEMFPEEGQDKPKRRFKGFSDAWEQRKLGEFADITKLAGFEFTKYIVYSDKGNIIALRGLNVKEGDLNLEDVKYIDSSDFTKLKRSKLFRNDILFTYVGTIGELARIQEDDKYYLAPNVSRIRIKNRLLSEFLMYYMDRDSFYQKIIFPLIATSSQPALSMANIREFNITYPSDINEQQKIALVFSRISHLITLHQRKLDKLKNLKQAYLNEMFV